MKTKPVQEVFTENGYLNVVTSQTVETRNILRVKTSDNKYETLEVKIIADFSTIDEVQSTFNQFHLVIIHFHNANHHQRKDGGSFGKLI
jgi:hypothetical protein